MENLKVAEGISIDSNAGFGYSPGDIIFLSSKTTPTGFLPCDGRTINQSEYPALFSVLGTYYDTAGIACKLPNLNQSTWIFPCSTVGNQVAYPAVSSSHTHSTANASAPSGTYTMAAHDHNSSNNSNATAYNHSHNGYSGGVGANVSSTIANRSNGSGAGVNLAIYGHTHSWGYAVNVGAVDDNHSHGSSITFTSVAQDHSHSATMNASTSSTEYIPNNAISLEYYIKW
jgi:microcystin-dependent protein